MTGMTTFSENEKVERLIKFLIGFLRKFIVFLTIHLYLEHMFMKI